MGSPRRRCSASAFGRSGLATVWLALGLAAGIARPPEPAGKWEADIRAFEAVDRASPPVPGGVVFVGSSSIRLWRTLAQDFPELRVMNRGFGGSLLAHSVTFAPRLVTPHAPACVVVYAGGNDIHQGRTPEEVSADFAALVEAVRTGTPGVPIVYISIAGNPARWAEVDRVRAANAAVARQCAAGEKLHFVDIFPAMLGADGMPRPELFVADRLHMSPAGYGIWTERLRPVLREILAALPAAGVEPARGLRPNGF